MNTDKNEGRNQAVRSEFLPLTYRNQSLTYLTPFIFERRADRYG